jgi:protein-L-isoaspartate O-methyltransferase
VSGGGLPDLRALHALVDRGGGSDRAFADAMIRMAWSRTSDPETRASLAALHGALQAASRRSHAALRAEIARRTLLGAALRRRFDDVPRFERDHFIEEVLGIAYPPLDEPVPAPELLAYAPSGYEEIVHAFDVTGLGPGDGFLDIGSGMGKAVMLAALLAGATSAGLECDGELHQLAEDASHALALGGARFHRGDARDALIEDADVVFMYLPFTGSVLTTVMARLMEDSRRRPPRSRPRFLCAGPLDPIRYPDLVPVGASKSWLNVYAWR